VAFTDIDAFAGAGNYLNSEYLKTLPRMACKVRIVDGGSRERKDIDNPGKTKTELFLLVESTTGTFEGRRDMTLNATNRAILKSRWPKADSWGGKEIGVFFDPTVAFGGKAVGGLKVKILDADPFADEKPAAVAASVVAEEPLPF
jgi:hypothetical protein